MMTSNIRSLEQTLFDNLPWNKARINFLARFLIAILTVRTVNLSKLATSFSGNAKEESNYKRLQRFFRHFELPYAQLANFIVGILGIPGPFTLALDRTNWKLGLVDINILMLSIIYKGIGFPVVWLPLGKAGASDSIEQITLIEIFIDLFGIENIACLLGDREFVGKLWFRFLKRNRIYFQMRLRRNTKVRNARGQMVQAWRLFAYTRINHILVIPRTRQMWDSDLYLSGCRLKDGEYLILVSAHYSPAPEKEYKKRWGIETLFGALKSRGFNLEDTRLRDPQRISKLIGLLAIAFTWAFLAGQWQATFKELKLKKHGYTPISTFRRGLNILCRLLTNFERFDLVVWTKVIKLLSCT